MSAIIQDARRHQRSGFKSDIGLILPTTTMAVDADDIGPQILAAAEPTWDPAKELD